MDSPTTNHTDPAIPRISDYWPDAPHRMGPEADYFPDQAEDSRPVTPAYPPAAPAYPPAAPAYPPAAPAAPAIGEPPRKRRGLRIFLAVLALLVLVGGGVLVLARMVLGTDDAGPTTGAAPQITALAPEAPNAPVSIAPAPSDPPSATVPPTSAPPASKAAALPFTSGTFELADDVTELNVTLADLGAAPIQATTPGGSGLKLRSTVGDGGVKLFADPTGSKGGGRVDVRLNRKVTWSVRMTGGVRDGTFALAGGSIRRVDLTGGAARLTIALGTPGETLPLRMTGGVGTWRITTATEVPVSVLLRRGAGEVTLNGHRSRNLDRNTQVRDNGRSGTESGGLGIDAVAGLGTLIVEPADQ